jgi:TonB family protein
MARRTYILPIALGCSLVIHLSGMGAWYAYSSIMARRAGHAPQYTELVVSLEDDSDRQDMGDATGKGIGSNNEPGQKPIEAPQADEDQALLSRDPEGMGRLSSTPTNYTGPQGAGAGGRPAVAAADPPIAPTPPSVTPEAAPPMPPTPPAAPQVAEASPDVQVAPPTTAPMPAISPTAVAVAPAPPRPPDAKPTITKPSVAEPKVATPATGDGRSPGLPQRSADPLPQSESDSDPFSRISGSVVVRDGRLDVRLGRKVKTTRPQLLLAGQIDLIALSNPTVVLEVHIAPTGNVTDVKIAHSSGSNQVDEPSRLCVYDWWFEPARNKAGQPVPDVIFFTIQYR